MSEQLAHELNLIVSDTRYSSEAIGITIRHRWPDIMSALRAPAARVSAPTRDLLARIMDAINRANPHIAGQPWTIPREVLTLLPSPSQAREEEREACAKLATWVDHGTSHPRAKDANDTIAAAIRARKEAS